MAYVVKYRTMVWWKAAALMLAETVSLGVRASHVPTAHHLLTTLLRRSYQSRLYSRASAWSPAASSLLA